MIGNFESPTFSNSHHHGAGFHGSPVEANARKRGKIVFFRQFVAVRGERTNERRRDAENFDFVFRGKFPHSVGFGIIGRAVVNADRRAVNQRAVNQPRSHHPADVGQPRNARSLADIRAERHILRRFDRKTRVRVRDAFRLAGRAGCVKNYQRVFGERRFKYKCLNSSFLCISYQFQPAIKNFIIKFRIFV